MFSKQSRLAALSAASLILLPGSAMSQSNDGNFDRDGVTPADQRPDAVSAPVPLPVGIFLVQPRVVFSGGFTSNLFASDINEEEASFVGFAPSFEVSSDWTRHALGGILEIDHLEVSDNSAESRTNVRLGVDGQFDITDSTRLTGKLLSEDINEDRTDISAIEGSIEPNEFSSLRGGLAMHHTGKTWQILADLDYASYDHDDVELPGDLFQDQDFRDKDEISGRLRVAYALSPNWAAYTQAQHVEADFDPPGFFNAFNRDYEGNTLSVGSDFALGDAVSGDIAIGFMSYAFDDPFFEDIDDVSVSGNVQWALADQTTLETELRRAVVDPGIVETIAAIETSVSVRLAHGLSSKVFLVGEAGFNNYEFENIDRTDDRVDARVGLNWKLNKNLWLEGNYELRDSTSPVQEFSENRVLFRMRVFP